jgi:hypothetical protein
MFERTITNPNNDPVILWNLAFITDNAMGATTIRDTKFKRVFTDLLFDALDHVFLEDHGFLAK